MSKHIVNEIREVCRQICDTDLDRLRLEEELLIQLVKSRKHKLNTKQHAFSRIDEINKQQRQLLGALV